MLKLLGRLEAATSRLEDIALASVGAAPLKQELSANTSSGQASTSAPAAAAPAVLDEPKSIKAYDEVVQAKLQPFVQLSESIGGPVLDQVSKRSVLSESNTMS